MVLHRWPALLRSWWKFYHHLIPGQSGRVSHRKIDVVPLVVFRVPQVERFGFVVVFKSPRVVMSKNANIVEPGRDAAQIIVAKNRCDAGFRFWSEKSTRNFTDCLMSLCAPRESRLNQSEEAEEWEEAGHQLGEG